MQFQVSPMADSSPSFRVETDSFHDMPTEVCVDASIVSVLRILLDRIEEHGEEHLPDAVRETVGIGKAVLARWDAEHPIPSPETGGTLIVPPQPLELDEPFFADAE